MKLKENNIFSNTLLSISILSLLVFWSKKFFSFDLSLIIFIVFPFLIYKIFISNRKQNLKKILLLSLSILILLAHSYIASPNVNILQNTHFLFSLIFLFYLLLIVEFYYNNIFEIIFSITNLFFLFFILSSLIGIINYAPDNPFLCGGLKNFFFSTEAIRAIGPEFFFKNGVKHITTNIHVTNEIDGGFDRINLSFREYLFIENSHLGMIAPPFIIFYIYYIFSRKINFLYKIFFILFLTLCFIKSSATLLIGLILSTIILLIFEYKRLSKNMIISYVILVSISSVLFFSDRQCVSKFDNIDNIFKSDFVSNLKDVKDTKKKIKSEKKRKKELESILKNGQSETCSPGTCLRSNLSSNLIVQKTKITIKSVLQKPIGWGFQQYENAHYQILEVNFENSSELNYELNNKDGMNNFNKIIVEFGIFGILFYFIILAYLFNKKIPLEEKFFLLPFIITQSIRGAGYFNGGFILIVFLILASYKQSLKLKKINQ